MTKLCVAIFVHSVEQARQDVVHAVESRADMVELRVDRLHETQRMRAVVNSPDDQSSQGRLPQHLAQIIWGILKGFAIPSIVTCRPQWEGGLCTLQEDQRMALLDACQSGDIAYIDIEWISLRDHPITRRGSTRIIGSYHDFQGRPDRLYNIVSELNASPADVVKIVWTARTIRDNLEAFEILKTRQKPTIALCMGEAGLISRVLAKKFGAFLTFASLDKSGGTASGQIPIEDMKKLYRWDAINEKTKVYGVVGSPIMHSMSPAIHNASFDAVGHDGIYLPLLVEPSYESFKAFMETFLNFEGLDLSGLSVTIPHKENALRYLQEKHADIEPLGQSIGAINTIIVDRSNGEIRLRGINTDYAAILDSITDKLGITREDLRKYKVAVIGAGGTGRTAVAGLAHYGATVSLYNRTPDRAEALAKEFDGRTGGVTPLPLDQLPAADCQIYLNTTSLGMYPKVDASIFDAGAPRLSSDSLVFDTIYNPIRTKLLGQAEEAHAKTISGVEMFVRQAVAQFEAWTGKPAPREIMRGVIERRLKS